MFNSYYHNHFYKVSENYVVSMISKIGCSTVALQTKCFNQKLNIEDFKEAEYKHITKLYKDSIFIEILKYKIDYRNVYKYPGQRVVALFRDPIERYMSIYSTDLPIHPNGNDFNDNLLKVKEHFDNKTELNYHYCPQYMFYDFDKIDIFVELNDYSKFCQEHNIPWIMVNKNGDPEYKKLVPTDEQKQIIKDIYNEDYILLYKIRNSNKLYIPKQ